MALPSRNSSIQSFCSLTRSGSIAPSCQVSKNDATSALSGSVVDHGSRVLFRGYDINRRLID
jgi:hypothetical protein